MKLRERRQRLGLTLKQVGALAGVTHSTVANVELGRSAFGPTVRAIEAVLTQAENDSGLAGADEA